MSHALESTPWQNGCGCGSICTPSLSSAPPRRGITTGSRNTPSPRIGHVKLNKVTSRKIQKLYKDLLENGWLRKKRRKKHPRLSGSTVRGVHIMLHNTLDRAVEERLLIRNLADNRVVPKVQHQEMKTLQPEDLKAYLGCNKTAERPGYVLSGVGQRLPQGRIGGENLDMKQRTISVSKQAAKDNKLIVARPKTENSIRQIPIPQEVVELVG